MYRFLVHLLPLIVSFAFSCVTQSKENTNKEKKDTLTYADQVGDLIFDAALDDPSFKPCSAKFIPQYYSFGADVYEGEKPALENFIRQRYKQEEDKGQNGYITIRFVVNCQGRTGWFRVQEMDFTYQPKKFTPKLVEQLLELTKQLNGWKPAQEGGTSYDYYYYLTFQLVNGQLKAIMP